MMVCISWLISLTLASPQALMFRKLKHPSLDFHQCTTNMVIETYSEVGFEDQQAKRGSMGKISKVYCQNPNSTKTQLN